MKFLFLLAAFVAVGGAAATGEEMAGVADPARARQNWMLKCQGCHRADASGTPGTTPPMTGMVARFAAAPGGRAYLAQVPGVATAALSDAELAELLNWTLQRFDKTHLGAGFVPYGETEVGRLRRAPLRTEAAAVRARIVAALDPP